MSSGVGVRCLLRRMHATHGMLRRHAIKPMDLACLLQATVREVAALHA